MDRRRACLAAAAIWAGGGLLANYAWEMLQMPLYTGAGQGLGWRRCLLAALAAVGVELHALAQGRWSYAPAMPRMPPLGRGSGDGTRASSG
ncbi:MAG TPA: hypothetical protein VGC93_18355 [Thermoanaerobaculia bacterium]